MTDRTVPTEPTPEMIEAGCRALHAMQGTGDADAPMHSPYQKSWDEPDSVRWRQWIHTIAGDEEDIGVYRAMVAASPAAPGAEVEPVAGLRYRSLEYDDWGMIRNADDSLFAVVRRPLDEDEAAAHRKAKTDPFEPLARVLMSALASPPTTDAIKAQARREALEEAAKVAEAERVENVPARVSSADLAFAIATVMATRKSIAERIRALAGKPGEAEPTEGPVVVYRPQRGSLAEAMSDRVAFYSIEAFKRHVLNEWPRCGSIAVEPYGGIDNRIGWDTHLVSVDGMAVGFADRAIPELAPPSAQGGGDGE